MFEYVPDCWWSSMYPNGCMDPNICSHSFISYTKWLLLLFLCPTNFEFIIGWFFLFKHRYARMERRKRGKVGIQVNNLYVHRSSLKEKVVLFIWFKYLIRPFLENVCNWLSPFLILGYRYIKIQAVLRSWAANLFLNKKRTLRSPRPFGMLRQ